MTKSSVCHSLCRLCQTPTPSLQLGLTQIILPTLTPRILGPLIDLSPSSEDAHSHTANKSKLTLRRASPAMNPFVSWGCVIAIATIVWWYYFRHDQVNGTKTKTSTPIARRGPTDPIPKRQERKKAAAVSSPNVADQGRASHKPLSQGGTAAARASAINDRKAESDDGEDINNKEWAKQLSMLKKGTSLTRPTQDGLNKKTRRANKQQASKLPLVENSGPSSSQDISTNSSTTGADADDDLSPAASPPLAALPNGRSVTTSGDVTDMLEAPGAGPSILRLTGTIDLPRAKQPQTKPFQVQESKKQRYARQKNESRKAQHEDAEKERRILLEKQLRTARLAEGRPAKDGAARSPPKEFDRGPWKARQETQVREDGTKRDVIHIPPEVQGGPSDYNNATLLDTFDQQGETVKAADITYIASLHKEQKKTVTPATSSKPPGPASEKTVISSKPGLPQTSATPRTEVEPVGSWADDLPSEEEQMRRIGSLSSNGWSTVEKRSKKNVSKPKNTKANGASNENSDAGNGPSQLSNQPWTIASSQPKGNTADGSGSKSNGAPYKPHPLDSDWAAA